MRTCVAVLSALALTAPSTADSPASEFTKSENWDGLKEYWKVENGVIVGNSGPEGIKFNTFLCSKQTYKDFEMTFKVRLKNMVGNSGIQIRSKVVDEEKKVVAGPQADIGAGYWGSLYGEKFGGMMQAADKTKIEPTLKKDDFNDYAIKCVGKHVTIVVNGVVAIDQSFEKMPEEGIIAFQLHSGPAMEVTFKDIVFKEIK